MSDRFDDFDDFDEFDVLDVLEREGDHESAYALRHDARAMDDVVRWVRRHAANPAGKVTDRLVVEAVKRYVRYT